MRITKNKFSLLLALVILIGQSVPIFTFGATYWMDGLIYIKLAASWVHNGNFASFYNPLMTCMGGHIPILPSLLWGVLYEIFHKHTWIFFVIIQRVTMGIAIYYLAVNFEKVIGKTAVLFSTVLLLMHPFVQSFQNMVMTESIAAAAIILILSSTLNMINLRKSYYAKYIFWLGTFLGMQARPQIFLFSFVMVVLVYMFNRREILKFALVSFAVAVFSFLMFPFYRYTQTGEYYLPNIKCLSVRSALQSYIGKPNNISEILSMQNIPENIIPDMAASQGISFEQSAEWLVHLESTGLSKGESERIINSAGTQIRLHNINGIISQIDSAFSGLGILHFHPLFKSEDILSEGFTKANWVKHYDYHYRWISFVSPDNYLERFDDFMSRAETKSRYGSTAISIMTETHRPYIAKYNSLRDPLNIKLIPVDLWFIGFAIGCVLLLKKNKKPAVVIGSTVLLNYVVVLFVGFGNIRYSYIIFPLMVFISGYSFITIIRTVVALIKK